MKVQSKESPQKTEMLQGGMLINFNVEEKTKEIMGTTETYFEYEQCKVSSEPTKAEIISAIIETKYDKNAQIAILYNGTATPEREAEYNEYRDFRAEAKQIASGIVG